MANFTRDIFLEFGKISRISIFLSTSKGCFWIFCKQGYRFDEFFISHFSRMYRSSRLQLFFKIDVLKNFVIFTVKHSKTTLLKGDSNTGVFLWILQKLFRTTFYIWHLRWLLLNLRRVCLLTCLVFIRSP